MNVNLTLLRPMVWNKYTPQKMQRAPLPNTHDPMLATTELTDNDLALLLLQNMPDVPPPLTQDFMLAPLDSSLELHQKLPLAQLPACFDPMLAPLDYCPLLTIPPELRNSIYGLVLQLQPDNDGYVTISDRPSSTGDGTGGQSVLNILRTCRQIRDEAAGVFYSSNKLHVGYRHEDPSHDTLKMLDSLCEFRLHALRHLAVNVDCHFHEGVGDTLRALQRRCPNLSSLRVYITGLKQSSDDLAFLIFRLRMIKKCWEHSDTLSGFPNLRYCELRAGDTARAMGRRGDPVAVRIIKDKINEMEGAVRKVLLKCTEAPYCPREDMKQW
ncbi:hypothetical protein LTR27_002685 [Elasticomyces elasticus]|nr:hypothetical protein LTR27_002685 [Elasticomyces elasticus]